MLSLEERCGCGLRPVERAVSFVAAVEGARGRRPEVCPRLPAAHFRLETHIPGNISLDGCVTNGYTSTVYFQQCKCRSGETRWLYWSKNWSLGFRSARRKKQT